MNVTPNEAHAADGGSGNEPSDDIRQRAREITSRLGKSNRHSQMHDRVSAAVDQHPLEIGLIAFGAGLIVGLALPTPESVNRSLGPAAEKLRQNTRDASTAMIAKGKQVVDSVVNSVKAKTMNEA